MLARINKRLSMIDIDIKIKQCSEQVKKLKVDIAAIPFEVNRSTRTGINDI